MPLSKTTRKPTGMTAFSIIWIGQIISVLATNMTGFTLTIWAFEKTGSATALALVQVCFITPFLIMSPLAGVMVDRYNRKLMMMVSDFGAGIGTILILWLASADALEVWHLYVAAAIAGTFNTFQWPAYSAAISLMVPKEQYGRANGMMTLIEMGPAVLAPMLAGALIPLIGLQGVLWVDVVTFSFAIGSLLVVFIPQPKTTSEGKQASGKWWQEAWFGFTYIFKRPSLLGLQMVFFFANFSAGIAYAVVAPMILARTGNNELIFGSVQSIGAVGGIVGGILMSTWGGFKKHTWGVLFGWIGAGILGFTLFGLGRGLVIWAIAFFINALLGPIINGSNQAIWQAKVAPDLQGRVFSARRLIAWFTTPISPLIGGLTADYILEPAMTEGGSLTSTFGWLVGTGPGAGMSLIIILMGMLTAVVGVLGYLNPKVRNAEELLPDHGQDAKKPEALSAEPVTEPNPA